MTGPRGRGRALAQLTGIAGDTDGEEEARPEGLEAGPSHHTAAAALSGLKAAGNATEAVSAVCPSRSARRPPVLGRGRCLQRQALANTQVTRDEFRGRAKSSPRGNP